MRNKNDGLSVQSNMFYNTLGSVIYLGCQWLISIIVVRFGSYNSAGVLSLAISITNIFSTVSTFGMRVYHVSDINGDYSESLYFKTRFLTAFSAFFFCVIFVLFNSYSAEQMLCIIFYMVFRVIEAFSDLFQGVQQKKYRMDYICVSFVLRGVLSLGTFTVVLKFTQNLVLAVLLMALSTAVVIIFYDYIICKKLAVITEKTDFKQSLSILKECYPLMFNSMFITSLISVPRYFLEQIDGSTMLGYYSSVAMPTVVVQNLCLFIYNPLISTFSECIRDKDKKRFAKAMKSVALMFAAVIIVSFVGAAYLGEWGLKLLYTESILPYAYLFIPVMAATIMIAMVYFLTMLLTVTRNNKGMTIINGIALALDAAISPAFIKHYSLDGINYALYIAIGADIIALSVFLLIELKKIFNSDKSIHERKDNMKYTPNDHTFVICAYKESSFLEECIISLEHQTVKSNIILATSTPNDYIGNLCKKHNIEMFVNNGTKGLGGDWNFGYDCVNTPLVTIAHQDDTYLKTYSEEILAAVNSAEKPIIAFSHYAELRNGEMVYNNQMLKIKKLMLTPLTIKVNQNIRFFKRLVIAYGNPICCPAVTYVKTEVGPSPFTNDFKSDIDWQKWEALSTLQGTFAYVSKPLMCHRIHTESTTSALIEDNSRTQEDYIMFRKFHSDFISKLLIKPYSKGQDSNKL